MYNALDVARYIIAYEMSQRRPVSNLRLQKLLYFVQAQFIASRDVPCFSSRMEAWDFGPVVPKVYRKYKIYGSATIPNSPASASLYAVSDEDKPPIDSMLDRCGCLSTSALVDISHGQSPWKDAYANPFSNEITAQAMRKYFRS